MSRIKSALCKSCLGAAIFFTLSASPLTIRAQAGRHIPVGVASDWTHHHLLSPESKKASFPARIPNQRRFTQAWYLRHHEAWWPEQRTVRRNAKAVARDWNFALGATTFVPQFDGTFTFAITSDTGSGSISATSQSGGGFQAVAGTLNVTATSDGGHLGLYPVYPGGPGIVNSPSGGFQYDNIYLPASIPQLSVVGGPLFINSAGYEINLWGNTPANNYSFYGSTAAAGKTYNYTATGTTFSMTMSPSTDPGGGQTFPSKYAFDVTAAPSCTSDYVVIGLPTAPGVGHQANLVGVNNLYTSPAGTGLCAGTAPTVKFAYASGSGEVPGDISLSLTGTQLAYVENLPPSSYFHVLTLGTTGTNGTSATASVVPGTSNNAVDKTVLLSPDGGVTTQNSTTGPFVNYDGGAAYATTYSTATNTGYLYKIGNVFNGSATPTILWSVAINAVPSAPVYDSVSNKIFFTDGKGRIDSVIDNASPTVVSSAVLASGATSENPVTLDSTNQMVYATFNSNGTNAIVVQAPTTLASAVTVPVGIANTTNTGPYGVEFNNAWYTGSGTPLMYVVGTGTGTLPTLYGIGFTGGVLNPASISSTALATGAADSSPLTEYYNTALGRDELFTGVTNHCIATTLGGTAGCVMSLDITSGFPAVTAATTALAAGGGTTGIVIDNDSGLAQASNIYYGTKTGSTLVKATQVGLN